MSSEALQKLMEKERKPELSLSPSDPAPSASLAQIAELQKAARESQVASRDAEWAGITSYNQDEIPPIMMAKLYAALPWGPNNTYLPIPQALMLAIVAHRRGLNPEDGDIFVLPSGKIGTSLQGMLKEARQNGNKLSAPKYTDVEREWPKGLVMERGGYRDKIEFSLPKDPGVKCEMTINEFPVEYTAWFTNWFMGSNPNWWLRRDWMLRVSAQKRCLSLGTGIGVSEDIVDVDNVVVSAAKESTATQKEPKSPNKIPFGGKNAEEMS